MNISEVQDNLTQVDGNSLRTFVSDYFGYGNLNSPYWFIGKEEGGSVTLAENNLRISKWVDMGSPTTLDTYVYHKNLGVSDYEFSRIQPTYTKIIQILLHLDGSGSDMDVRRAFQAGKLGRVDANHALLELMPLASRSTGLWLWKEQVSKALNLHTRKQYWETIMPKRIVALKDLIAKYKPKLVLFYSTQSDYINAWSQIAGAGAWEWHKISPYMKYGLQQVGNTLYVITTHPTMKGIKGTDFTEVAEAIKSRLTP
jgi:hypothetical protein